MAHAGSQHAHAVLTPNGRHRSRPHRSLDKTSPRGRREVIRLRIKRRWGADHVAHEVGLAASTVQSILNAEAMDRLDRGDRASDREPVRRYQRDRPGELVHIDVKKLSGSQPVVAGASTAAAKPRR